MIFVLVCSPTVDCVKWSTGVCKWISRYQTGDITKIFDMHGQRFWGNSTSENIRWKKKQRIISETLTGSFMFDQDSVWDFGFTAIISRPRKVQSRLPHFKMSSSLDFLLLILDLMRIYFQKKTFFHLVKSTLVVQLSVLTTTKRVL